MAHANFKIHIWSFIFFVSLGFYTQAQEKFNFTKHQITVEGTSNIHDWEMDVEKINGEVNLNQQAEQFDFISISLQIPVKSMKSGKGKMDRNTYEALKETKHEFIEFTSTEILEIENKGNTTFLVNVKGKLSIAGKTQTVIIPLEVNTATSSLTAQHELNMNDYGVDPPTAVFGTIKTGESVKINFKLNYSK